MTHTRKFVPGAFSTVIDRLKHPPETMDQDGIEKILIQSGLLDKAPFKWVGLMYRLDAHNHLIPWKGRISKKDGELPIAVHLSIDVLKTAEQISYDFAREIYRVAALDSLIFIGNKYGLPVKILEDERKKYCDIPETVEEVNKLGKNGLLKG